MKHTSIIGASLGMTCAIVAMSIASVNTVAPQLIVADGPQNTVLSLSNNDLTGVTFEDFVIDETKGIDKKFRIPLAGGNYIDGAVVYNDCGHQFLGGTLADPFGINNKYDGAEGNAYNFNILFSFRNIISFSLTADITNKDTSKSEYGHLQVKFAKINGDFYSTLANTSYDDLKNHSGVKISNFYATGLNQTEYGGFYLTEEVTTKTYACTPNPGDLNVAAFQFTYDNNNFVDIGNIITCTIQNLTFTYTC